MFKTILVPVDGSEPSEKALNFALDVAASQNAGVHLCHVPVRSKAQWDDIQQAGRAILEAARYRAQASGVRAETSLRSGSPADAIVELAEGDGVDLIIMGSHGYEGPVRALASSTSETVIQRAPVPVIVLGPNSSWDADADGAAACV